jgi:hypothetical protein
VFEHIGPELVVSSLRLLVDIYKLARDRFKDKKTPDRVEEIVIRAEQNKNLDAKQIEESITKTLDADDAAIVKSDLELLSLLITPAPSLDAFDYWGKLTQLVHGLQAFAERNRLFELRGVNHNILGASLYLEKTSGQILPKKVAKNLPEPNRSQRMDRVECMAILQRKPQDFPIRMIVGARFEEFDHFGSSHHAVYEISQGQQKHWLRFFLNTTHTYFHENYEYRLEAADMISISNALRDDIRDYAAEIQADEQKIGPLFA